MTVITPTLGPVLAMINLCATFEDSLRRFQR